ncbi:MAG: alanine--tRNA ligase [Balneolales bacterium]
MSVHTSDQIRQDFFNFFREKEHLIIESAPVVPRDDPSLLFINAGMNPFKPVFLGEQTGLKRSGKIWHRVANSQKCIRVSGKHNDLEQVGHDTYHHTMFEMLGNWSFGDYFKREAIAWAWELLVDRWKLDPDRLYATVFEGDSQDGLPADDEAAGFWASETSIKKDHILKFGKKDNFWEMGETGPSGPCSEIHIDLRSEEEREKVNGAKLINRDDPRVMEIWNLVFIQFNRKKDGALHALPARHVDTGMGFERIVAVLQGKKSNYDTDVFASLLDAISKRAGISYGKAEETDIAMRVVADHIRSVSFAVADGVTPSNEDRGYVIRRILRRASRYAWDRLHIREAFMSELVDVPAEQFQEVFPELKEKIKQVKKAIKAEETSFLRTLDQGIAYFDQMADGRDRLSGEDAFKLHDTYGFPIDLTDLMAAERGISVDHDRFTELMQEQKERARKAGKFKPGGGRDEKSTTADLLLRKASGKGSGFTGYDELEISCQILEIEEINGTPVLLLDRTPFYAESGGQVADTGIITNTTTGEKLKVTDVQLVDEHRIHFLDRMPESKESTWVAAVDAGRRAAIERNHTATHLLHAAMREILGQHVAQRGSLVAPDRLRFDFSHYEPVSDALLDEIEERVNEKIRENIALEEDRDIPIEEAKKRGATMLFGEKYGDRVRVITFDPGYSMELCGGTHVDATGRIGYFRLISESSVAAGIRRVEALTGQRADRHLRHEKKLLQQIQTQLGLNDDPVAEITRLLEEKKQLAKRLEKQSRMEAGKKLEEILSQAVTTGKGIRLAAGEIEGVDMSTLKQLGYDALQKSAENTVVVLGSRDEDNGKVYLMAAVSEDVVTSGIEAGTLVGALAKIVGGGGGGQNNLATAGGRQPEKLPEVFDQAKMLLS